MCSYARYWVFLFCMRCIFCVSFCMRGRCAFVLNVRCMYLRYVCFCFVCALYLRACARFCSVCLCMRGMCVFVLYVRFIHSRHVRCTYVAVRVVWGGLSGMHYAIDARGIYICNTCVVCTAASRYHSSHQLFIVPRRPTRPAPGHTKPFHTHCTLCTVRQIIYR